MFGWLKKLKYRPPNPESLWTVGIDGDVITGTDHTGAVMSISTPDLAAIAIETNDSGPWGADVWWLLFDSGGKLGLTFPQLATGEEVVIAYILALPNCDHQQVSKAMACTDNAVFPIWQRRK